MTDKYVADIRNEERNIAANVKWNDGELGYLICLISQRGDDNVTRDPKTIAAYLRLQASSAFYDGRLTLSACIGAAATAINADARNDHAPDWARAREALEVAHSKP